jgi:hypothetical protein
VTPAPKDDPTAGRLADELGQPEPWSEALESRYRSRMGPRLLIAAGEAATSAAQLPFGVRSLIDAAEEIMVIAPRLPGRLDWITSDTDKATEQADERLRAVLGHLDEVGSPAHGRVGADDPLLAFEDAFRDFAPDHLLIGLRPQDRAGWQERGLLDEIQARFAIPMTVFLLGAE